MVRYLGDRFCILIVLVIYCFSVISSENKSSEITIPLLVSSDEFNLLDAYFSQPVNIKKIVFKSDIDIPESELRYLTGLEENSTISLEKLKKACWHLKQKKKFESLVLKLETHKKEKNLIFNLKSAWTFSKVKFKGPLVGKDKYRQYYLLEPGEPFDITKHQHSVDRILQELKNEGYLQASVIPKISYEKKNKQVSVVIDLQKADRFTIQSVSVTVKGPDKTEHKNLEKKIQKKLANELQKSYYTKQLIDEHITSLKKYLAQKGFLQATIEVDMTLNKKKAEVSLIFKLTIAQKKSFIFLSNQFFSTEQLLEELLLLDNNVALIPPSLLSEEIKSLYKKKGFWQVDVQWREEPHALTFTITEGNRIKVPRVTVKGATFEKTDAILQSSFADFYALLFFDAEVLRSSIDKFITAFIQEGFWDFVILKQEYLKMEDENSRELVLTIDQGRRRMLVGVTIEQFPELMNREPFLQLAKVEEPKPFNISIVEQQRQWLLNYFHAQGYMYVKVTPELVEQKNGVLLKWNIIQNGGQVKFGKTIITGSNRISPEIILRELQYKEGELWSKEKIDQTLKRLKSLNMFETVSIIPQNLAEPEEIKTIVLKIVEDDPFEIKARVGFAQVSKNFTHLPGTTFRIGGSFLWKNPLGIADQLRLDGDLTRFSRNIALSYELPWIFNHPIRTLIRGYSSHFGQPLISGSSHRLFTESREGILVSFNRLFSRCNFAVSSGAEFMKISGLSCNLAKVIDFEPSLVDRRTPYLYIEPSIIVDRYDNPNDPRKGYYTLFSTKGMLAPTVKNASFIKFLFEQSVVYSFFNWLTGAVRLRAGHIFTNNFSEIMPKERFYLGGPSTLRGYEPEMAPPINSAIECNNGKNERIWAPVGGRTMVNLNAELRFDIYKNFGAVIFNDMGYLTQTKLSEIRTKNILGSTGFGVRYATPIGPVRFDIGWKWSKRRPDDRPFAWYLTFGHAF